MRRKVSLRRRIAVYAGPAALGTVWLAALLGAAGLTWMQRTGGATTALAVTRSHALRAPESGWVVEVTVQPGLAVEAGATVARLEVPGMAQDLAAAEAEVRFAQEGLQLEEADRGRRFSKEVEDARRALLAAQVQLATERGGLAQASSDLQRLSTPGAETAAGLIDQRRTQIAALELALASRDAQVSALEASFNAARTRANVTFTGEAQLAQAVARRDALAARLASAELRATAAGIVGPLVPTPGEWTTAGTPLFTITEPVSHEVVAYVAVPYARSLAVGAGVDIHPDGGTTVPGTIAWIGPAVELVPEPLRPPVATWAMPVHIVTAGVLVPGETVGVGL